MSQHSLAHHTTELSEVERRQEELAALISMAHSLAAQRESANPSMRETLEGLLRAIGPQIHATREALVALGVEVSHD